VTIPNIISIARLLAVPLIVWLIIAHHPLAAFVVFVLAGISDGIDGFLARHLNLRSDLGGYLDPLADKALLTSIFISLTVLGDIPALVTILVVSRDVFIVAAIVLAWMLGRPMVIRPVLISKLNTVAQIALAGIVLADLAFGLELVNLRYWLIVAVVVLTLSSAGVYLVEWTRHMGNSYAAAPVKEAERGPPP
jgi:cardiolipin synthase